MNENGHTHAERWPITRDGAPLCALIGHTWREHASAADGVYSWYTCDTCGECAPGARGLDAHGERPGAHTVSRSWSAPPAHLNEPASPPPPAWRPVDVERVAHAAGSLAFCADLALALALHVAGLSWLALAWLALVALGWIGHAGRARARTRGGA